MFIERLLWAKCCIPESHESVYNVCGVGEVEVNV